MAYSGLCVALRSSNMSYTLAHTVSPLPDTALSIFRIGILYFAVVSESGVVPSVVDGDENRHSFFDRIRA